MSQFECSVKDLNHKPEEIVEEIVEEIDTEESTKNISSKNKQNKNSYINKSLFDKIFEEKNVRIILLITIAYLITSSSQFIELLGNSFPYLVDSGITNLSGKVVTSILIGLSVVIFTSFFQVP